MMDFRGGRTVMPAVFALTLISALYFLTSFDSTASTFTIEKHSKKTFRAPKHNVWSELSQEETTSVYDFVKRERLDVHPDPSQRTNDDNLIFAVETLRPNKTDAVSYLFEDSTEPERWAKVSISEILEDGPYMVFYMVGPLPVSEKTQILPLSYPFTTGTNYVKHPVHDFFALIGVTQEVAAELSDITEKLFGAKLNPDNLNDPEGITVVPRVTAVDEGGLMMWAQFFRPGLGSGARTLLPQGLYVQIDARSRNSSEWNFGRLFYNGQLYENADHFREALHDSSFHKVPQNLDGSWTETEDFDAHPEGRELPPPVSIQPHGKRYKLDREEKFVSWFGFEFYITTAATTGLTFFDIRFNGERVMYELGLQEAMAHYAGQDPMQGGLEFMDSFFGMGTNMFELVPGYDCPAYADYLDSSWSQAHDYSRVPNSICVFEYTSDHLLSRHSAQYSITASRNTYLLVRAVSTVGNYDYTFDYVFYMDGTIEVKVRASGFIFSAFHTSNSTLEVDEYGHHIHDALSSSVHDHVLNFKADLDVAGPRNDMVISLGPAQIKERNTMHLRKIPVREETGLDWPKNSGEFYIVHNSEQTNAWGEPRGYRITSGTGMGNTIHLTILNSTVLGDAARWAEKDIWVLRRKDTEPRSADPLNWFATHNPLVNFTAIADGESLEHDEDSDYDGDLVVYFNLGAHHLPHSGDLPNTLMHTSASSVMFIPHNFNNRDPSRQSVQGVRLQLKGNQSGGFAGQEVDPDLRSRVAKRSKKSEHHAKYFGATYNEDVKVSLKSLEPNLIESYKSSELGVTDLGFNRSAAGVRMRGG